MKYFFVTFIAVFFFSFSLNAQDSYPNLEFQLVHSSPVTLDGQEVQVEFTIEISSDRPIVVDKGEPFIVSVEEGGDISVIPCLAGSDYGYNVETEKKRFFGTVKLPREGIKECQKIMLSIFKFDCNGDSYQQSLNLRLR